MTTLRTFSNQIEAALVASFLQDNEIEAALLDQNASAYTGPTITIPIRLQVPEEQFEEARRLLAEFDAASHPSEGDS